MGAETDFINLKVKATRNIWCILFKHCIKCVLLYFQLWLHYTSRKCLVIASEKEKGWKCIKFDSYNPKKITSFLIFWYSLIKMSYFEMKFLEISSKWMGYSFHIVTLKSRINSMFANFHVNVREFNVWLTSTIVSKNIDLVKWSVIFLFHA